MADDVRRDFMGARVLVVEDDEDVSRLLARILSLTGNGDEARRTFRRVVNRCAR